MNWDIGPYISAAILGNTLIAAELPLYLGVKTVFSRRPVPDAAPYPMIVVSDDVTLDNVDGVNDFRPVIVRDIVVYGQNDTVAHYNQVQRIGYLIRDMFHRKKDSVSIPTWGVLQVVCRGPMSAPTDVLTTMGSVVPTTFILSARR